MRAFDPKITRRNLIKTIVASGLLQGYAPGKEPDDDGSKDRTMKRDIKLGFDNFSIRAMNWNASQLLEYAGKMQVDTVLFSNLAVYESHDEGYLRDVKDQATELGIEIQAGTNSICPTSTTFDNRYGDAQQHLELSIRIARTLGSPVLRCYLGNRRDREGDGGIYRHIEKTVEVCKGAKNLALDSGVKIAIENHAGDMQAWELVELIEAAGKDFVGATVDSGNATWTVGDPVESLRRLAPYAASSGIRDSMVWESHRGAHVAWTNMGDGNVDWEAFLDLFLSSCPGVPIQIETISGAVREMPYLERDFWSLYPEAKAADFAAFLALAKRGSEYEPPPDRPIDDGSEGARRKQQLFDLESSIRYCKEVLGLGLKGTLSGKAQSR